MRRGFSLIELLTVITISSVIFTVLSVSIFALHRTQSQVQSEAHTATALGNFARRLRTDAHAAVEVSLNVDPAADAAAQESLVLTWDDGRQVVYDFDARQARIRRQVRRGAETLHRDTFALPRHAEIRWSPPAEDGPRLLAAIVLQPVGRESKQDRPCRQMRIEAAVGLDQRFAE